jgi:predicted metal-dependent peptidase
MKTRSPNAQEEKRKAAAAQTLETDRVRLVIDQPFVGAILIRQNLIPVSDSRCPTAATDGQNIFVNPDFYLSLSPAGRRFLLAHEVWHTVFLHFQRRNGRDVQLFNIATDMEVNQMLLGEGFQVIEGSLLPPPEWRNLNAEEIYERLLKELEKEKGKGKGKGTGKNKNKETEKKPLDVHLEPGNDPQASSADEDSQGTATETVVDPDYQVDFGSHPEEKIREKVVEAAVQCEKKRGTLPAEVARIVENFRAGKLHWKELLAQFVTSCFGGSRRWLPPNRRYISSGLYLQSRRDSKLQAVLAIDTSGSTGEDLPQFAGELANLLNTFGQYELKVICCDAKIQSVETYTPDEPFDGKKVKFKGGGGTSFKPVFEYMKKNPCEAPILIYFTDGHGDIPEKPPYPVMWVITPNGNNRIPWGYEIILDEQ